MTGYIAKKKAKSNSLPFLCLWATRAEEMTCKETHPTRDRRLPCPLKEKTVDESPGCRREGKKQSNYSLLDCDKACSNLHNRDIISISTY